MQTYTKDELIARLAALYEFEAEYTDLVDRNGFLGAREINRIEELKEKFDIEQGDSFWDNSYLLEQEIAKFHGADDEV